MKLPRLANQVGRLSVVRILLAGLALVIAVIARDITVGVLGSVLSLGRNTPRIWLGPPKAITDAGAAAVAYSVSAFLIMVSFGFGAYWLYSRLIERRRPSELAWKSAPRELALGSLIGSGLVLTVVGVLAAFGYFRTCGTNPWIAAVPAFSMAATAAFMEELAVRGIVFRIIEQRLGTWVALALSAALFGGLHATNPGASWASTLTIAVTAGLVLGAAYVLTHRLWLAIGVHFAVNAVQGGLLGLPVSGHQTQGLFCSTVSGPTVWTGGTFGIEASVIMLILGLMLGGAMLLRATHMRQIVPPFWKSAA